MNDDITVVRVVRSFPPNIGGLENHVYELSNWQSEYIKINVIIPYMNAKKGRFHLVKIPSPRIYPLSEEKRFKRIIGWLFIFTFELLSFIYIITLLRRKAIFHYHGDSLSLFFAFLVKKILKKKTFLTIHSGIRGGFFLRYKRIGRSLINNLDTVFVVNSEIKNIIMQLDVSENKIIVLSSGIRKEFISLKITKKTDLNKWLIIFTGRIRAMKGLDILIDAFEKTQECLSPKNIHLHLKIIGDGPKLKQIENIILNRNLHSRISFEGKIAHKRIIKYYKKADIFVLPSRRTNFDNEGTPTAILEALASGLIVVSSNFSGAKDTIIDGKNGYIFKMNDVEDLKDTLIKIILNNSETNYTMRKNAQVYGRKYDWEIRAKEFTKYYIINK